MGVTIAPGHNKLTRMPCGASYADTQVVKPIKPCLEVT
jgi:hypothetical protein